MKIQELINLIPFKVELISTSKNRLLNELRVGELYRENDSKFNPFQYHVSCDLSDDRYIIKLTDLSYVNKIDTNKLNIFTYRDKIPQVFTPIIFRQLSGKNKGKICWFPYFEAWKEYSTIESIKHDLETKGKEKRYFLPTYLNDTFYK
jgi:hypothetical protein